MSREELIAEALAAGWDDPDAYAVYLDDADGGRHPLRAKETSR